MSGHEGLMDELIVITNLLQQHQRQTLIEQLSAPDRDGDGRDSLLPRMLRGYLDKVHNAAWLDAVAAHLSRVPAEWVEAACAVTRELALEPKELAPEPPRRGETGHIYIPTHPPSMRFVRHEHAAALQARLNRLIAAILRNDAALLPADMRQVKPES